MRPNAQVDLGDCVQAQPVERVYQEADLHAVAGGKWQRCQQLPAGRILTAQRLQYTTQLGRSAANSGRATSSVTLPPPVAHTPLVTSLTCSGRR